MRISVRYDLVNTGRNFPPLNKKLNNILNFNIPSINTYLDYTYR